MEEDNKNNIETMGQKQEDKKAAKEQKQNQGSNMAQKGQKVAKGLKKAGKAAQKGKKAAKIAKAVKSLKVVVSLGWVALIILAIILVVGLVSFFFTMPGLYLENFKEAARNLWDSIVGRFIDNTIKVSDEDIIELAQRIDSMGYNIQNYGFANVTSHNENNVPLSVGETPDEKNYLEEYLKANEATYTTNQWSFENAWKALGNTGTFRDWSQGMIHVEDGLLSSHSIDRENEQLVIKTMDFKANIFASQINEMRYDLSSWTARYGKPVELMLALHLSTMMPDLTYDIATHPVFNTKIEMVTNKVKLKYEVQYEVGDNKFIDGKRINEIKKIADEKKANNYEIDQELTQINNANAIANNQTLPPPVYKVKDPNLNPLEGTELASLTEEEFNALIQLVKNGEEGIDVKWPRIESVTQHWFYNPIIFQYGITSNTVDAGTITYQPEEGSILSKYKDNIKLTGTITGDSYYQLCSPEVTGPNEAIKAVFKGGTVDYQGEKENFSGKYYQFDGTSTTAQEIYNAKAVEAGKSYYDFGGQTQIPVKKDIKVEKKPVNFNVETTLEDGTKISGKKNAFTAFSILEGMHTEASKQIYRCLQDLLVSLGYFTEDDFQVPSTQVLEWPIKEFTPVIWPKRDANQYGSSVQSKSSLDEGFESGLTVTCPGDGTITEIGSNSIKIKFKQLSDETITYLEDLYKEDNIKIDKNCILDMELIIQGINVDSLLSVNKIIKRGDTIGTTSESDILFIMYNKDKSIIDNIEDYMSPTYAPTDITIDNNYVVDTNKSPAQVTDVETFKKAFKPYPVLVENAQAFIDIQTKYHVNALFAGAVAVAESSGGTNGFLITNKTYNMFSIQGSYNGESYMSHNSEGEEIYWKKYPDFATAIDDFGKLISTSTNYIGGGNITIVDIGIKYCPPGRSWATSVSQHMTDAIERIT